MSNLHYKPRKISEIDLDSDKMISVIGKVIQFNENSFVLSDGKDQIEILSEAPVESSKLMRIFCSVENQQLKANLVQSLNGFDVDLFNRIEELYKVRGL
jgi:hypothetical protein